MINADLDERKKQIEELVINNNLDYATLRFMDFATDFARDKKYLRFAHKLRYDYTVLHDNERLGTIARDIIKIETSQLVQNILSYVGEISEIFNEYKSIKKDISNSEKNSSYPASSEVLLDNDHKIDKGDTKYKRAKHIHARKQRGIKFNNPRLRFEGRGNYKRYESTLFNFKIFNIHVGLSLTKYELEKKAYFQKPKASKYFNSNLVFEGKGICKNYKVRSTKFNLRSIDLNLRLSEITAIVGENGNGKTTLLRIIAGELAASQGEVSYPYWTSSGDTDWYSIKKQIAYVPQELPKWHGLLVENLQFAASIHDITGKDNDREVDWIIYRLGLEQYKKAKWNEISGGYKRRFALAMALICKPKLLILDEPMANLDINTQMRFLQDLRDLANSCKYPIAVVISSQNLYDIEIIADQIIFIKNGRAAYSTLR